MVLSKEILKTDELLDLIACDIDMTLINPTNAEAIKETYSGKEPEFIYHNPPSFVVVQEQLKRLTFPKTPEGKLLEEKKDYLLLKTELLRNIGTKKFASISKKIYPLPSKKLIEEAKKILAENNSKKAPKVELHDACEELQDCINQLGIPWEVKRADMIASALVVPSKRILYIKEKKQFSKRFIDRLKIHEIGTHAVRAENGRLQKLKVFKLGFADYLSTEEGLAAYNEEKFGLLDRTVLRTYAGRVMAIHYAQKHTFTEVAEKLMEWFPKKKAITIALRAKRGVSSGSDRGGFTKDSAYLRGYLALKEYEAQGGDFTPLYYGKVSLESLPILQKMKWLKKPKYYPEMIKLG